MDNVPLDIWSHIFSGLVYEDLMQVQRTCKSFKAAVDGICVRGDAVSYGHPVHVWSNAMQTHALPHRTRWRVGNAHAFHFVIGNINYVSYYDMHVRAGALSEVPVFTYYLNTCGSLALAARTVGWVLIDYAYVERHWEQLRTVRRMHISLACTRVHVESFLERVSQCTDLILNSSPHESRFSRLQVALEGRVHGCVFTKVVYVWPFEYGFPLASAQTNVTVDGRSPPFFRVTDAVLRRFRSVQTLTLKFCNLVSCKGMYPTVTSLHCIDSIVPDNVHALFPSLLHLTETK